MDIGSRLPLSALSGLSAPSASQQKPKDLESAAKAFESLFVNELMKSMRKANEALLSETDMPLMSDDVKFFQSMFDDQIGRDLSDRGGLGIAEALIRQLGSAGQPTASPYKRWDEEGK